MSEDFLSKLTKEANKVLHTSVVGDFEIKVIDEFLTPTIKVSSKKLNKTASFTLDKIGIFYADETNKFYNEETNNEVSNGDLNDLAIERFFQES